MSDKLIPLSPTVASIFAEFLKKLETEKTVGADAIEALRKAFDEQKFDPESLRKAVFAPVETAQ
jgi:hypothetical protein